MLSSNALINRLKGFLKHSFVSSLTKLSIIQCSFLRHTSIKLTGEKTNWLSSSLYVYIDHCVPGNSPMPSPPLIGMPGVELSVVIFIKIIKNILQKQSLIFIFFSLDLNTLVSGGRVKSRFLSTSFDGAIYQVCFQIDLVSSL